MRKRNCGKTDGNWNRHLAPIFWIVLATALLLAVAGCGSRQEDSDGTANVPTDSGAVSSSSPADGTPTSPVGGEAETSSPAATKPGGVAPDTIPASSEGVEGAPAGQTTPETAVASPGKPTVAEPSSPPPDATSAAGEATPETTVASPSKPTATEPSSPPPDATSATEQAAPEASAASPGKPSASDANSVAADVPTGQTPIGGQPSPETAAPTIGKPRPGAPTSTDAASADPGQPAATPAGTAAPDPSAAKPSPQETSASSVPPPDSAGTDSSVVAPDKPDSAAPPAEPTQGPTTSSSPPLSSGNVFAQAEQALDELQSYRYRATASYGGTLDGETREGSYELEGAVVGSERYQLEWVDRNSNNRLAVVEIDGQAWMLEHDVWQSVPNSIARGVAGVVSMYVPADSWDTLEDDFLGEPMYEGDQTVNGIRTRHYSSVLSLVEQGDTLDARGDVWIAEDGGYPVRFTMDADIGGADGEHANIELSVELSDVNESIVIEPPM